ncbi:MAG: phage tail protein [Armatimonadia bacterium]
MSFFGSQATGTKPQKLTTLSVQTSSYGICMGMAWGTARITGNLIWYGDFEAIEHTEDMGGKGGGGMTSTNYTYRTAFAFGLLETQVASIPRVWSGKDKTDLGKLGLDLMTGAAGQSPWSYLASKHAGEALNYPGIAYVGAASFDLGNSASLPNLAFEVQTTTAGVAGTPDAAPWTIVTDLLTAGGFPGARVGSLSAYTNFTGANGLFLSPALMEQKRAADHVQDVLDMTHTAPVASEGVLKLIPYGDTGAIANGYTFTPTTAPVYDLTDDDFLGLDGELPIRIKRKAQSDAKNRLRIEFKDRANEYATGAVSASDEAHIAQCGERPADTIQYDAIKTADIASKVAYLKLQRGLYVLNEYELRLGWRYCLLEPMDVVTLTHSLLGMARVPVRIVAIEEDSEGALTITAEDFPQGAGQAPIVPPQPPSGYSTDMNVAPGNAAAPVVFEPPIGLAGQPELWLATSGGATYGGCAVWVSLDNVTYKQVGVLSGKSRHGITTAALPLVSDPDTTSTLAVDLSVSGASLLGGTATDRDLFSTLCWVGGELVSYQSANLTGANAYAITSLRRGAYGSPITAHASASKFVRCDDRVFRYAYDPAIIGKTLYIKLQAYNIYAGAYQDLASLTPTAYVVQGAPLGTVGGLALEQPFVGTACAIKWTAYKGASSYTVEVWSGGTKRRTVTGLGSSRYAYSYEDAKADGGPYRNLEFRVYAVAGNGTSGSPAVITASNPQIGAPTGIATAAAGSSLVINTNRPTDTDYAGTRVWVSTTSGFNPGATTPAYDGPNNWYSGMGLASGTYYVRIAHYDVFGTDGMATSGELAITVVGVNGVRTVTALPANPAAVNGDMAVFLDTATAIQRGIWGWDGSAWKCTRDGANLVANSVAADRLAVSSLSAITANMGSITSGSLTLDAAGFVRGGSTGYMTGAGIWMGYHSGLYKMHVGSPTGSGFTWDGTTFTIRGASGQVLLSSGNGVPWGQISDKPADGQIVNNLIDPSTWTAGDGGAPGFNCKGSVWESYREPQPLPDGSKGLVWHCLPGRNYNGGWGWDGTGYAGSAPAGDADGGWNTDPFKIDPTKMYRFTVWVKRSGGTTGATFFGTSPVTEYSGSVNGNPYFWSGLLPTFDRWFLLVGYVFPAGLAWQGQSNRGGVWDSVTGQKVSNGLDYLWTPGQSTAVHRAYLFYSAPGCTQYMCWPRVDLCDGTEPSIDALLSMSAVSGRNKITQGNASTFIDDAAIGSAQIGSVALVGVGNFSVKSATAGARTEMDSRVIKVFDASGVLRVKLGDLSA